MQVLSCVSRWVEKEERTRHVLWITGGIDIFERLTVDESLDEPAAFICRSLTTNGKVYCNISSITLVRLHGGKRGQLKYRPSSSIGELSSGELYCVYRFIGTGLRSKLERQLVG